MFVMCACCGRSGCAGEGKRPHTIVNEKVYKEKKNPRQGKFTRVGVYV